jgi:hypothetical protein
MADIGGNADFIVPAYIPCVSQGLAVSDLVVRCQRLLPKRWLNRPTKSEANGKIWRLFPSDFIH